MPSWSFLTNHARALICIAHDPDVRLRDIAEALEITERSAFSILTDLIAAGFVHKDKQGRRNRYQIEPLLSLGGGIGGEQTIGELLKVLLATGDT